jgi:NAD(P)H-hydrate repair Nnr-like enzyme with NAD(P)H-hydrate epimerase domain
MTSPEEQLDEHKEKDKKSHAELKESLTEIRVLAETAGAGRTKMVDELAEINTKLDVLISHGNGDKGGDVA